MDAIEERLAALGLALPQAAVPAATYVPYLLTGSQLFISGQLPMGPDGLAYRGRLGESIEVADGQMAAQLCALNILAQAKAALGTLERITRCVRLNGFVNAAPGFGEHPAVINGASDLMIKALGEKGPHTRIAVGVSSLPFDAAVEIDATFEIA